MEGRPSNLDLKRECVATLDHATLALSKPRTVPEWRAWSARALVGHSVGHTVPHKRPRSECLRDHQDKQEEASPLASGDGGDATYA